MSDKTSNKKSASDAPDDDMILYISPAQYRLVRAWHIAGFAETEKLGNELKKVLIDAAEMVEAFDPVKPKRRK